MLIPKLAFDEYYWKGQVHCMNDPEDNEKRRSLIGVYKPERSTLIPFSLTRDQDFIIRIRNGEARRYVNSTIAMNYDYEKVWTAF